MIFGLQYLRGIAALMVVLIHAKVAVNHFVPSTRFILPDQGFVQFGKYGVDIFFVISGMVMYMTIGKCMRSDRGIGDFIIKVDPRGSSILDVSGTICYSLNGNRQDA